MLTLLYMLLPVKAGFAATTRVTDCDPTPGLQKNQVPIALVHGFWGGPDVWDGTLANGPSMKTSLGYVQGAYIVKPFDYRNFSTHWVNDPAIGPKLAHTIACLAQASLDVGGHGKVIAIAHSMGGLAIRYAATCGSPDCQAAAKSLGLVITIGTPNFGSLVGDAFGPVADALCAGQNVVIAINNHLLHSANTEECREWTAVSAMETGMQSKVGRLPMLPQSIPLMGIAGDVHSMLQAFNSTISVTDSDTLVPVASALVGHPQTASGAGTKVFKCNAWWTGFFPQSDGTCAHGNLPKDPDVQQQVVKSIRLYLASLLPNPCPVITGTCIGIKSGDMDGNGLPDRVGITYLPNNCQSGVTSSCRIGIHLVLDSGVVVEGLIPWTPPSPPPIHANLLGISDIRGNSNGVIFLNISGDCSGCAALYTYQLQQNKLQLLEFPGSGLEPNGLGLGIANSSVGIGFTCQAAGDKHQVILSILPDYASGSGDFTASEKLYQSSADGSMSLAGQRITTYTKQQANATVGAHCPGLTTF